METTQTSLGYWLNRTSRALQRLMEQRLRPFGFGPSHLPILGTLNREGVHTQSALARAANVEQPTMAKLLSRMERDGLVTTDEHPEDGRATRVLLTRRARTAFPKGLEALSALEEEVLGGLSRAEQAQLLVLLMRVLATSEALLQSSEAACEPAAKGKR